MPIIAMSIYDDRPAMYHVILRGGHSGGAGGALATPGVSMFQEQVIPCHQSGDTL